MTTWFEARGGMGGNVAVVTGGAGGLGGAISRDLAANGSRLAVIDIDAEAAAELARDLPDAIVLVGDVREPEQLDALFARVDDEWGRLDTLVNVPGGTFSAPFTETNVRGWDALLRINFVHVLHACSRAIPRMRASGRGGSIVSLSTVECHRAAPGFAVYAAAKAALEQFARTLAVELGPDHIRVNVVAPDFTPTPNMARISGRSADPAESDRSISIPMGRPGALDDISGCVVFLASALSDYVTGSVLHPDGGNYASSGWFNWPEIGWRNSIPPEVLRLLE